MKELTQIRQAVIDALCEAGLHALAAFPDCRAPRDTPSTTVAVGAAEGTALGFCNYLGQQYDPEQGTVTECYGKLLDGEISVEIRAPGASGCEQICEQAAEVLLGGLPAGIRPGELRGEAICWEKETGMFLRRGSLRCRAVFTALAREDGETFLDFTLKGVMKQ